MAIDLDNLDRPQPAAAAASLVRLRQDNTLSISVAVDRDFNDIVDEWGAQSFPASDPPSNW